MAACWECGQERKHAFECETCGAPEHEPNDPITDEKLPERFIDTVDDLSKARARIRELEIRNGALLAALVRAEAALLNAAQRSEAEAETTRQAALDANHASDPRKRR